MKKLFAFLILAVVMFAPGAKAQVVGTTHSVVATITPPLTVGGSGTLQGFNLYRAPGGTVNYVKLNTAVIPAAAPTYTDTTVTAATQYAYCATSVDSANSESACTIASVVTIPVSVNPPAAISLTPH